ncbi:MAG: molybdopterin molybdenumtransferase MoeA [Rhodobacteraceae bacterium]|nr:molybdopterin molybdenumtransferase MoeA [Paracoccaceae bacterium]
MAEALGAGERVLIGADFAFGFPAGFSRALTGRDAALAVWDWLAGRITDDARNRNNRFAVAAEMNRALPGLGPFWFRPAGPDLPDLPLKGRARHGHGMAETRVTDARAPGAQPVWKLGGAGSVGSQVLTGLPVLWRLRAAYPGKVAVWPFEETRTAAVVLAEVFPSLLRERIAAVMPSRRGKPGRHDWPVMDAVQVRMLALALARLGDGVDALLAAPDRTAPLAEEGWILGVGAEARLIAAAAGVGGDALPPRAGAGAADAPGAPARDQGAGRSGGASPVAGDPAPERMRLTPPRLRNDCFAMPQGVDWVPVDAALARLRAALAPLTDVEESAVAGAGGRVLAADVAARRSNPPHANAAVDGYGFAHAALAGEGPHELPLVTGRAAAGQPLDAPVPPGAAVRILTGAILPEGVDTVVLEEDCASDGARVAFDGPVKRGANARRAGEDVAAGAPVLTAGRRLTPADLALLSALGVGRVKVLRRLRVAVLSTGDELLDDPGTDAPPHRIFDANRPMLLEVARRWGHVPVDLGCAPDDPAEIAARLDRGAREADVILTSGGASAGDEDHVSRLLRARARLSSWRIALKPGRPLALALWPGGGDGGVAVPVIGLPGNPVAALVCTLIFGRPALSMLSGAGWVAPLGFDVPAAFGKRKKPGRREYLRARLDAQGAAEVFASEGSGRISGLSWAEGLVELPDGAATIRPGDPVRYLPYAGFGLG